MELEVALLPGRFAVCRLDPEEPLPHWPAGAFVSLTRTAGELSIVCEESAVPAGIHSVRGWRALRVEGPLPFDMTGVAASIASPLAARGISLLLIATFDTDHVFVRDESLEEAVSALREAGHRIDQAGSS